MSAFHTKPIQAALLRLDDDRQTLLAAWEAMIRGSGTPFFPLDLLASGAVKRGVSASAAIKVLVESWNMLSARSLLRTHLDTALRFSAVWLVENPHEFASLAISGKPINKLKDREGKALTDARLVEIRSPDWPWLPKVYENLCGYVHFSATHLFDAVESLDEQGEINLLISETDESFPESSWLELIHCFRESTAMLVKFVNGYAITKRLTREQLDEGRRQAWGAGRSTCVTPNRLVFDALRLKSRRSVLSRLARRRAGQSAGALNQVGIPRHKRGRAVGSPDAAVALHQSGKYFEQHPIVEAESVLHVLRPA